jgi:predicted AAA+ superfamily ATPase
MDKNIALQQKKEKELLLARNYIGREQVEKFKSHLDSSQIKVITGPRRAGKSVFCFELLRGKNFAYLNFDDENILKIKNYDDIEALLYEVYPGHKYIFFDEIQNLPDWELFVSKLHRRGANLIITGSNAKLLAREMATALTGRYVPLEVLPFSFREFLEAVKFDLNAREAGIPGNKGRLLALLETYMTGGGFPEVVVNGLDPGPYLSTLFDAVVFKDVSARHKIRSPKDIYSLAIFMASNPACEFSYKKMAGFAGLKSTATLVKYASYLEESYIFEILNRFSFKVKKQANSPKKVYLTDNGFMRAKGLAAGANAGRLMENMFYVEMLRRGYEKNKSIFYYRSDNGAEIDFVMTRGGKTEKLVQVCRDIDAPLVLEREIRPLVSQAEALRCSNLEIVTWDKEGEETYKGKKVRIIPVWKVMLEPV